MRLAYGDAVYIFIPASNRLNGVINSSRLIVLYGLGGDVNRSVVSRGLSGPSPDHPGQTCLAVNTPLRLAANPRGQVRTEKTALT